MSLAAYLWGLKRVWESLAVTLVGSSFVVWAVASAGYWPVWAGFPLYGLAPAALILCVRVARRWVPWWAAAGLVGAMIHPAVYVLVASGSAVIAASKSRCSKGGLVGLSLLLPIFLVSLEAISGLSVGWPLALASMCFPAAAWWRMTLARCRL